ncbi:MAG TPA: hypothetical protein VN756_07075 [Solirubrobacterales bacterium]|nr:hypothetical protein [Solirubrobacterales bacterium]
MVGTGVAHIGFDAPEQTLVQTPLTLVNGGVKDGLTRLFVHSSTPTPIVTTVKITRHEQGQFGTQAIWRIPSILEGSGSLRDFSFKIERRFEYKGVRRSYLSARCLDGQLAVAIPQAKFRNEADTPGIAQTTVMKGGFVSPCKAR